MGLLDTLKEVKNEGFDPKKDTVSDFEDLPSGDYVVRLKSAGTRYNEKLSQSEITFNLEVVSGEHKGSIEFLSLSFEDEVPDFVKKKNARILLKLNELLDIKAAESELNDEVKTAEAFSDRGVGNQVLMKLRLSKNKKNPDFPYRNYEFEPVPDEPEDPFGGIGEEELPF
ncbi:DUF669 domain-containing protein [Aerococcus mictus]|uniref:DUF669 domain-containing protein n=1 Tax=Aerococcus mictus TaxID=2976810 RepID=UPI000DCCA38B|nr:DUF669 domain-containing protein [Aerococcus mictus]WMF94809.1 DUF669 domain-containing protein [Aerococcus mictus]